VVGEVCGTAGSNRCGGVQCVVVGDPTTVPGSINLWAEFKWDKWNGPNNNVPHTHNNNTTQHTHNFK